MTPWELIDSVLVPGTRDELSLYRRGDEYSIRVGREELMNSLQHGSEEALARIACARLGHVQSPHVLIGGLGMGYTLAAALARLGEDACVTVAELAAAVIKWNGGPLAGLSGSPLTDGRVTVVEGDVAALLRDSADEFDAILLDVDNGPEAFTRHANHWLYGSEGLRASFKALRAGGVLAVWSADPEPKFTVRLRQAGFAVEEYPVPAGGAQGDEEHRIWLASRPR